MNKSFLSSNPWIHMITHKKKERIYYWSFKNYLSNLYVSLTTFLKRKMKLGLHFCLILSEKNMQLKIVWILELFRIFIMTKKNLFYGTWFQRLTCYPFFWSLISQTRKSSPVNWSRWWTKYMGKKLSLEPDSNQWSMDAYIKAYYSPPLYQLSYRGIDKN